MEKFDIASALLSSKPNPDLEPNKISQYVLTCKRIGALLCDSDDDFIAFLRAAGLIDDETGYWTVAK